MTRRIMVDMSATLLHHGHIRLLQHAANHGDVIVGLTTDDEVLARKYFKPELPFEARKEILLSIRYVSEVVPTPWLITEDVLDRYHIDLLAHGDDNSNHIPASRLLIFPRTPEVSSTELRIRSQDSLASISAAASAGTKTIPER